MKEEKSRGILSRTRALSSSVRWGRSAGASDADVALVASAPGPVRTSSWRVKASLRVKTRQGNGRAELTALVGRMRNVRESKLAELCEKEGYLSSADFDNSRLSLDELHLAAVLMLERSAPCAAFSDKAGVAMLYEFVDRVRAVYKTNPYHDFRHAVDVMQFMNHLLSREDIAKLLAANGKIAGSNGPEELNFILLVACLCHDSGHDGMTNAFHRKTQSELFARFGEESILERLHYSLAEEILEGSGILETLKETQGMARDSNQVLDEVKNLILATDMEKHKAVLTTYSASPSTNIPHILIKLADISNVTRPFDEAKIWAKRLEAEMKLAASKMPANPSATPPPPLSQTVIGFSKMFAVPLIDALTEAGLYDSARDIRSKVEDNIAMWEKETAQGGVNGGL